MKRLINAAIITSFVVVTTLFLTQCFENVRAIDAEPSLTFIPDKQYPDWKDCDYKVGSRICDVKLIDQYDQYWQLYDHHGSIIVLDISAMWCVPCQAAASNMLAEQDAYQNDNVIFATILLQDLVGQPPTLEGIQMWANVFDLTTSPVLMGDISLVDPKGIKGFDVDVFPTILIIDRDMHIVRHMDGFDQPLLRLWVEDLILEN